MNAILLGAASLGALVVFFTHDPHANFASADKAEDRGWMTRTVEVDPETGEKTGEVSVIAFLDE